MPSSDFVNLIALMIADQIGLHSVLLPLLIMVSLLCVDAGSAVALYQWYGYQDFEGNCWAGDTKECTKLFELHSLWRNLSWSSCKLWHHHHHPLTILVDRTSMMTIPLGLAFCMPHSNMYGGGHLDLYVCDKELQGPFLYWLVTLFCHTKWINAFYDILTKSCQLITLSWKRVTKLNVFLCFVAKKKTDFFYW